MSEQRPTLDYGRPSPKRRMMLTWRGQFLALGIAVVLAVLAMIFINCFFHD